MDPVEAAFTAIGTEISTMTGHAWPIATAVTVAIIGIGLFKKFAQRAAK
ncbi:hypothetical protein M2404_003376 [Rheinheimera pacifica]|nr:major coat protein [Rheinheimera pacifica]MCS4309013.1 hypothetical protein [Rheinheimera pacifica]